MFLLSLVNQSALPVILGLDDSARILNCSWNIEHDVSNDYYEFCLGPFRKILVERGQSRDLEAARLDVVKGGDYGL